MNQTESFVCPAEGCVETFRQPRALSGHCRTSHDLGVRDGEETSRAVQLVVLEGLRECLRSGPRMGYNGWPTVFDVALKTPFTKQRCQRAMKDLTDRELVETAWTLEKEKRTEVMSAVIAPVRSEDQRPTQFRRRSNVA